jgi:hypothetical protein
VSRQWILIVATTPTTSTFEPISSEAEGGSLPYPSSLVRETGFVHFSTMFINRPFSAFCRYFIGMGRKRYTILAIVLPLVTLICLSACSPKAPLASGPSGSVARGGPDSPLVGGWKTESGGMTWQWSFARDGSFIWRILGQTDMGGKPVDIQGGGGFSIDAMTLTLNFDTFPGIPGMLRSGNAAPGFDARTEIGLRFAGRSAMSWKFESKVLGEQELSFARIE